MINWLGSFCLVKSSQMSARSPQVKLNDVLLHDCQARHTNRHQDRLLWTDKTWPPPNHELESVYIIITIND